MAYSRKFRLINLFILRHRLLIFLSSLLSLLIVFPFINQFYSEYLPAMDIFFSIILITGTYIVSADRRTFVISILLGTLTLSVMWFNLLLHSRGLILFGLALKIIFFLLTTSVILLHVLSYRRVTPDKIYGAICGYLLIGLVWALAFSLIEYIFNGSFHFGQGVGQITSHNQYPNYYYIEFIYYSFVTLTTLGYGDITPLSSPARYFSALEAVVGQLYVAVLISRLVGLHIANSFHKIRADKS